MCDRREVGVTLPVCTRMCFSTKSLHGEAYEQSVQAYGFIPE